MMLEHVGTLLLKKNTASRMAFPQSVLSQIHSHHEFEIIWSILVLFHGPLTAALIILSSGRQFVKVAKSM